MRDKVIVFLGMFLFAFVIIGSSYGTNQYHRLALVTEVEDSNVEVVDESGNIWCFEGTGYKVGDKVNLTMYTNCTDSYIQDDRIENVKVIK